MDSSKGDPISLRFQRNFLPKLSNRHLVKLFTKETQVAIDAAHKLLTAYYGVNVADRVVKCLQKLIVKLVLLVLARNPPGVDSTRTRVIEQMGERFKRLVLTLLSFQKIDCTYDYDYLLAGLNSVKSPIAELVRSGALHGKSIERVEFIFHHLCSREFLDFVFSPRTTGQDRFRTREELELPTIDFLHALDRLV